MKVCVFCGSRPGREHHLEAAGSLGTAIAGRRHELIYGGACVGMMGALAAATRAGGGRVTGVLPSMLSGCEIAADSLDELVVVESLAERKAIMFERADAFIVLPGGVGTLDELSDVLVLAHLGLSNKPVAVVDSELFYRPLASLVAGMIESGFVDNATTSRLAFHEDAGAALDWLEVMAASRELNFSILVPATMADTWEALVDPARTCHWLFGTTLDAMPRHGSGYTYRSANGNAALAGTFHAVEPPSLLEMTFSAVHSEHLASEPASLLRWRLLPRADHTQLQLRHSGLERSPATAARAARDWPIALEKLSRLLSSPRKASGEASNWHASRGK